MPGRQGRGHDSIPTYRAFAAANDSELVITANTEKMWQGLCGVLGLEALIIDARFRTNEERYANREQLWPLLEAAFRKRAARAWVPLLQAAGIPVGEVNTLADSLSDPQVLHRDMVLDLAGRDGDRVRVVGNPVKFAGADGGDHRYPPALGEHTRGILGSVLELSDQEIDGYLKDGVIAEAKP